MGADDMGWDDMGSDQLESPRAIAHAVHARANGGDRDPHPGPGGDHSAFDAALAAAFAALGPVRTALLASVASPELTQRVCLALEQQGIAWERVHVEAGGTGSRPASARLAPCYAEPRQFGVDRWLALRAARRIAADAPVLLASCGTALTVDLLDAHGRHRGGCIAPSAQTMAQALYARAPHLPGLDRTAAAPAVGPALFACDTAGAIAAGCRASAVGLLLEAWRQANVLLGRPPRLLLTGGGAPSLQAELEQALLRAGSEAHAPPSYHAWLVLDGLAQLARERAPDG